MNLDFEISRNDWFLSDLAVQHFFCVSGKSSLGKTSMSIDCLFVSLPRNLTSI